MSVTNSLIVTSTDTNGNTRSKTYTNIKPLGVDGCYLQRLEAFAIGTVALAGDTYKKIDSVTVIKKSMRNSVLIDGATLDSEFVLKFNGNVLQDESVIKSTDAGVTKLGDHKYRFELEYTCAAPQEISVIPFSNPQFGMKFTSTCNATFDEDGGSDEAIYKLIATFDVPQDADTIAWAEESDLYSDTDGWCFGFTCGAPEAGKYSYSFYYIYFKEVSE